MSDIQVGDVVKVLLPEQLTPTNALAVRFAGIMAIVMEMHEYPMSPGHGFARVLPIGGHEYVPIELGLSHAC